MPAVAQRRPLPKPAPDADPRFRKVMEQLKQGAAKTRLHPPAAKKAREASAAAKGPPNEKLATGKAKQVDKIQEAPAKKPESNSFLALLRSQIQEAMPKTLGDTENFMKGGSAGQMKGSLKGNVSQQKDEAAGGVKTASKEAPKEAGQAKDAKPIPAEGAPAAPAVNGAEAMPAPKPDADVSLQDSKQDADAQMKEAEVSPQQLQKANDPRFSAVLQTKDAVGKQADTAPGQFRVAEQGVAAGAAAKAQADAKKGATGMVAVRGGSNSAVLSKQQAAKAKDEAARKQVTDRIEAIYNRTKKNVEDKLATLETEVGSIFDAGVDAALNTMTEYVEARISRYKIDRYLLRPFGFALWIRDQFKGLPDEVNAFYQAGRELFTRTMDALVVRVADLVEKRLKEAKDEVAKGQAEIKKFVESQPKELQSVAQAAQKEVAGRFEELERGIDDKKNQLAQQLGQKYKEAFDKANDALKKIQDENKGLVAAFLEKLAAVIKILTEFKAKLMGILRKGQEAIKLILADPIGFLGNLLKAIKGGFGKFMDNIEKHLKQGFMEWLFGSLAEAGIEIPSDLSLPSILKLALGVLGITYERMRAKAVKLLGPAAVTIIEKVVEYVKALIEGGPAKLWEMVKEDLSNLKEMVIDAIQDWLISTIIKKATMKLMLLFNPVGAIVQAVMMIYDVVVFIVEKAAQILAFIEAVVNSMMAIATGAIDEAIGKIEAALARMIPLLIGFLAQLLNLGGITKQIKEFILKIQNKVDKAIDKAIAKVVALVKKLFGGGKDTSKPDEPTAEQKKADLDKGFDEANQLLANQDLSPEEVSQKLGGIKAKYKLISLQLVKDNATETEETDHIEAENSPKKSGPKVKHALKGWEAEHNVHEHVAPEPAKAKGKKGESHHVPYKVLKRWFGEIMEAAGAYLVKQGDEARGKTMKSTGTQYKNDEAGKGLSAIWLSEKAHDLSHAPVKPGELSNLRGDFVVKKEDDEVSSKPMRHTIASSTHAAIIDQSTSTADTKKKRNKEIAEVKVKRLPSFFNSVFESALSAGIALVNRVKLKDEKWKGKLRTLARTTWSKILKP